MVDDSIKNGKNLQKKPETSCATYVSDILYPPALKDPALDYGIAMWLKNL